MAVALVDRFPQRGTRPTHLEGAWREDLAVEFGRRGYQRIVEVGVERGAFTEILRRHNPTAAIVAIDAWVPYRGYRDHTSRAKLEAFYQDARTRLADLGIEVIRGFSADVVQRIGPVDAVYLDANHSFDYIMRDLIDWSRQVRPGGIVSGHDYVPGRVGTWQVARAVDAYVDAHDIRAYYTVGGGHTEAASFWWEQP